MKALKPFTHLVKHYKRKKLLKDVDAYGGDTIAAHTRTCRVIFKGNRIVVFNEKEKSRELRTKKDPSGTLNDLFIRPDAEHVRSVLII